MKNTKIQPLFIRNNNIDFGIKRKPIVGSYDSLRQTRSYLYNYSRSERGDFLDLSTFVNSSSLDPYFKNPGSQSDSCERLSNTLYTTNRIYQNLLDYLSNMYYWRYVSTPRRIKTKTGKLVESEYRNVYNKMIEVIEGLNVEVSFPKLLLTIFKNGKVYLYTRVNKNSKTITTIILPDNYCRSTIMTQYGTSQIEFDFSFFDTLATDEPTRQKLFELFPEDFKELYIQWKQSKDYDKWIPLNPKFSTCISMNEAGFPTFLSVFYDIIDHKNYKLNELDRNTNGLERLVAQEINLDSANMELPELQELHASMAEAIDGNGTTLVTSPGSIHVEQLQDERSTENKVLENAYKSIFDNAGFNNSLFVGDSVEALKTSLNRDMRFVWGYIEQLSNFYNLAINNLFNFGVYQLSFKILPISPYNEEEKLGLYRDNATLGIGIVDCLVASGIKQSDIEATLDMEEFLDLHDRLLPLASSYTQSSSTNSVENKEDSNTNENGLDDSKSEEKEEVNIKNEL